MEANDFRVKQYRVVRNATVYNVNEYYNTATPISKGGDRVVIPKERIVKSLGKTKRYRIQSNEKPEFLVLISGDAVKLEDVEFEKQEEKCCDDSVLGNTAKKTESNLTGDTEKSDVKKPDQAAYLNKSRFDSGMVKGALVGAVLLGAVMWFTTHDKVKTMLGIVAGAVLGGVIGRFVGRSGGAVVDKKTFTPSEIEKEVEVGTEKVEEIQAKDASKEMFLQIGQAYTFFNIPQDVYALKYDQGALWVAKDKSGNKIKKEKGAVTGMIVEVQKPIMFVLNAKTKNIEKWQSNKPLPLLEVGKDLYIPLALTESTSVVTDVEVQMYAMGKTELAEEVYIKGRYAGKRFFYLTYMPQLTEAIKNVKE